MNTCNACVSWRERLSGGVDRTLETEEKAYWNKDVARIVGIGESTVRKWCIELEKNGYKFIRGFKDSRAFLQHDLNAMIYFKSLVKDSSYSFSQAAEMVVSKYGGEKHGEDKTASVPVENERSKHSIDDLNENLSKLVKLAEEQVKIITEQNEVNKFLVEELREYKSKIEKQDNLVKSLKEDMLLLEQLNVEEERSEHVHEQKEQYDKERKKKRLTERISSFFKK